MKYVVSNKERKGCSMKDILPGIRQMTNKEARVVYTITFNELDGGFFRRKQDKEGKVYYAFHKGRMIFVFPVLSTGKVSTHADGSMQPNPSMEIETLDAEDLGIAHLEWEKVPE